MSSCLSSVRSSSIVQTSPSHTERLAPSLGSESTVPRHRLLTLVSFPFSFFPMIFSFFFPLLVLRPLSFVSLFFRAHQLPNHTHHRRRRQQHKRRPPTPDMKHSFGGHVPGRDQLTYTYTFSPSKVPPPPTDRPTRTDGPSPTPPQTTTMSMTPTTLFTPPPRETPPLLSEGHISPRPHSSQRLEQGHIQDDSRFYYSLELALRNNTNHDTGASSLGIKGANHHTTNNRHQSCEHSTINRPQNAPIIHHSIKWQHLPRLPPNITQHTPPAPAPARTTSASSPAYPRLPPAPPPFPPPSAAAAAAPHTAAYAAPPA